MVLSASPPERVSGRFLILTPWYHGWNVVAVAMLYQAVVWGVGLSCFTYFVSPWMETFHVGRAQIMIALSLEILLVGGLAPLAGRFVDRASMTVLVTLAAVLFAGGMLLVSAATALWQIIAVYTVILSIGMTLAGPLTSTTLAVRWFRARRGLAMGLVLSGSPIGSIIMPPLVTAWLAHSGWRMTHVFIGLIGAALIPIVLLVVRGSPETAGVATEAHNTRTAALAEEHSTKSWTMLQVVRSPALWIIVLAFVPFSIINLAVQANIAPFAKDLGFSLAAAGRLMPVIGIVGLGAKLFYGALSDRLDTRVLFYIAAFSIGAGLILMRSSPSYPLMLLACALFSFGEGAALLLIGSIVAVRFGPSTYGTAIGMVYFFVMTLAGLGPVVGGYLRDVTGTYATMFLVMTVMLAPAVVAMTLLRRGHRGGKAPALGPQAAAE